MIDVSTIREAMSYLYFVPHNLGDDWTQRFNHHESPREPARETLGC